MSKPLNIPLMALAAAFAIGGRTPSAHAATAYFVNQPATASLPGRASCHSDVLSDANSIELRPENATANRTSATAANGGTPTSYTYPKAGFDSSFWSETDRAGVNMRTRLNRADFTATGATTTRQLRDGACAWGLDEDILKAAAKAESQWYMSKGPNQGLGDLTSDASMCGWLHLSVPCYRSRGIFQVAPYWHEGWSGGGVTGPSDGGGDEAPSNLRRVVDLSTTYSVYDYSAHLRACREHKMPWLGSAYMATNDATPTSLSTQPNGVAGGSIRSGNGLTWGCVGVWFYGEWRPDDPNHYIQTVQGHFLTKPWQQPGF
jgi:hypothetical protein